MLSMVTLLLCITGFASVKVCDVGPPVIDHTIKKDVSVAPSYDLTDVIQYNLVGAADPGVPNEPASTTSYAEAENVVTPGVAYKSAAFIDRHRRLRNDDINTTDNLKLPASIESNLNKPPGFRQRE